MITTITTSTVTTVTVIAAMGLSGVISLIALISLAAFLTTKEVAGATQSASNLRMAKFINIGAVPLIIAFAVIVVVKVLEVVG